MPTKKQKIFFSYSRADGSAFALRLAQDLKQQGFDVWIDQEDIKPGLEWDTEIEKALECCDCVLFLETAKSVTSQNVLDEVYYALEQKKRVIPLIYVDSKTPFRLKRLQHIDFTKDYKAGLAQLANELGSGATGLAYLHDTDSAVSTQERPVKTRIPLIAGVVAGIVLLMIAVFFVVTKQKSPPVEVIGAASAADTLTSEQKPVAGTRADSSLAEAEKPATDSKPETGNRSSAVIKKPRVLPAARPSRAAVPEKPADQESDNLAGLVAGNWRLAGVEPAAQSQRGYLKIEAMEGGKATIKTYLQFYYPESKASSYLTIFNAFAGCTACTVSRAMKLTTEDVAIGSRTIKKATEDGPDGQKAGDVILDANSNKSVGGTVSLQFVDASTAIIKVKQSRTITLAHELVLEPFEYTFRLKKSD